jgi:non-specific serine/threonine protein kinase
MSPRQSAKQASYGLTAREREVAILVARGLTNRQIAEDLFISEETATVHVKHILNKLNFTSRVQIAAWAVQKALLTTPPDELV